MKRKIVAGVFALLVVSTLAAWPTVGRWRENVRRQTVNADVPQSERILRVPTNERLRSAFPKDSRRILEQSQRLELLSLEPTEDWDTTHPLFHRHGILGKTVITDATSKAALLTSLYDGFVPPQSNGLKQIGFGCFMPRHGIRATRNGQTVDLLICFSCRHIQIYRNGQQISATFVTDAPRPTFNRVLMQSHISISD